MHTLYLRLLSLCYFFAFVSLIPQVDALFGSQSYSQPDIGLTVPSLNPDALDFLRSPSLYLINSRLFSPANMAGLGSMISILLFFARFELFSLISLYLLYLSLVSIGGIFLSYQWDMLLLEAGFISIFLARSSLIPQSIHRYAFMALNWLLFRLMFGSGVVKLTGEDPSHRTWLNLTALTYHFETQPLPTPLAIFSHSLPPMVNKFNCFVALIIELIVPFFIFIAPLRKTAAYSFILLQFLIALNGNYCFFNLLTAALALTLLFDPKTENPENLKADRKNKIEKISAPLCATILTLQFAASSIAMANTLLGDSFFAGLPRGLQFFYGVGQNFGIASSYGLFACMTVERPELAIEGSIDGKTFSEYVFRYKVGPLDRPPPLVAPLQPRLDWQMWFEALNTDISGESISYNPSAWFLRFLYALKQGDAKVLSLLDHDPFKGGRPVVLRVRLYRYHFNSPEQLLNTGRWWRREDLGILLNF